MEPGDIILVAFPFADIPVAKARPTVFIRHTVDKHEDFIVCPITTSISKTEPENEIILKPTAINNLKKESVVVVDRLFTVRKSRVADKIGQLTKSEFNLVKEKLRDLFK